MFSSNFKLQLNDSLVCSRDVVFAEERFIYDIEKAPAPTPQICGDLVGLSTPQLVPTPIFTKVQDDDIEHNVPKVNIPADDDNIDVDHQNHPKDQPPPPPVKRGERGHIPSTIYASTEYICLIDEGQTIYIDEAMESDEREPWMEVIKDKTSSLHENHTCDLVKLSKGKNALRNRSVYKLKQNENAKKPNYKARIVVKRCNQKKGVDFK